MNDTALALTSIGFGTLVSLTGALMFTARWERLSRTEFTANPASTVAGGLVLVALGIGVALRDSDVSWAAPACLVAAILLGVAATAISLLGAPRWARPQGNDAVKESHDDR